VFCPRLRLNSQCARSNARRALATTGTKYLGHADVGRKFAPSATRSNKRDIDKSLFVRADSRVRDRKPMALRPLCFGRLLHDRSREAYSFSSRPCGFSSLDFASRQRAKRSHVVEGSHRVHRSRRMGTAMAANLAAAADVRSRRCTLRSLRIICSSAESRRRYFHIVAVLTPRQ